MDYWKECIQAALEEAGITATEEQIKTITEIVECSHENYGMHMGHECIPNPVQMENERLRSELNREKDKVTCDECRGSGQIVSYGGTMQCTSQCYKCRGEGRIDPGKLSWNRRP